MARCSRCGGDGNDPFYCNPDCCRKCGGTGQVPDQKQEPQYKRCSRCGGDGNDPFYNSSCTKCGGAGKVQV